MRKRAALVRGLTRTNAVPTTESETLTLVSINVHGQTGFTLGKQKQIQDCIIQYNADIVACQEINIDDETFGQCLNLTCNYTIVSNNAENGYGTAMFVSNSLNYDNVKRDTSGKIISLDIGNFTMTNVYLQSGNDRVSRNVRENEIAETLPEILQTNKASGACIGDYNCIINNKDATRNQNDKQSPSLKRLVSALQWKDSFRLLYPSDLVFSREYDSVAHGPGATRIDRCYVYGDVEVLEVQYVGAAFSDHMIQIVKLKLPPSCQKSISPRNSPLFKAKPEAVRDEVFKARLREEYIVWEEARNTGNISTLDWWENTVKPGIKSLLRRRGKEIREDRRGQINLLQLRQSYLVKKIQQSGRNVAARGGNVRQLLAELRMVQADINQWYSDETERIKIQAKTDDINSSEKVRIYHHENHRKHIRKSSIMKLDTEEGMKEGHRECMDYLENNVEKVFGNAAILDRAAQQKRTISCCQLM